MKPIDRGVEKNSATFFEKKPFKIKGDIMTWEDIIKLNRGDEWEERHASKIYQLYLDIYKRIDIVTKGIEGMKYEELGEPVNFSAYLPSTSWEEREVEFFEKLHKKLEKLAMYKRMMINSMQRLFEHDSGKNKVSKEKYYDIADALERASKTQKGIIDFEKLTQALGE